jgi:DNA-binding NarL/FixJ family response regulator
VSKIRVVLADDNSAILADVRGELSEEFDIVGAVGNGAEVIGEVARLDPDILVLDITMPGVNGIQLASRLRNAHPRTKIVFLTIQEQAEYIAAAFSAGARGYVTKRWLGSDLATAIREVFNGGTFLSASLRK